MRVVTGLVLAAFSGALASPAPAAEGEAACRAEAPKVCPKEYAARDRAAVRACLVRNLEKLSPPCQTYMKAKLGASKVRPPA